MRGGSVPVGVVVSGPSVVVGWLKFWFLNVTWGASGVSLPRSRIRHWFSIWLARPVVVVVAELVFSQFPGHFLSHPVLFERAGRQWSKSRRIFERKWLRVVVAYVYFAVSSTVRFLLRGRVSPP